MGSKNRFAKYLLPIILNNRYDGQWYVEPFAGGMNLIDKVDGNRIANDNNKYLIEMWKGLIHGIKYPHSIPKELYNKARQCYNNHKNGIDDTTMSDDMIGWIGFMASFKGRFFDGGYSGKTQPKNGKSRDYINESIRNINKQIPFVRDIIFYCNDYKNINIPPNSIIYCDIPYDGKKQYSTSKSFNHTEFWEWAKYMTLDGHDVFISEYQAPPNFKCIWEKSACSSLSNSGNKRSVERLFILDKHAI